MMSNGWSSHLLRNTERQWGHASVTCSPPVHDRVFIHQLPVFILQWWWHLSTNALPERAFQGHRSPELLACPTCSPQADSHNKQSFVFRWECREDKGGTPTCLLLHPMKKSKLPVLKSTAYHFYFIPHHSSSHSLGLKHRTLFFSWVHKLIFFFKVCVLAVSLPWVLFRHWLLFYIQCYLLRDVFREHPV